MNNFSIFKAFCYINNFNYSYLYSLVYSKKLCLILIVFVKNQQTQYYSIQQA